MGCDQNHGATALEIRREPVLQDRRGSGRQSFGPIHYSGMDGVVPYKLSVHREWLRAVINRHNRGRRVERSRTYYDIIQLVIFYDFRYRRPDWACPTEGITTGIKKALQKPRYSD